MSNVSWWYYIFILLWCDIVAVSVRSKSPNRVFERTTNGTIKYYNIIANTNAAVTVLVSFASHVGRQSLLGVFSPKLVYCSSCTSEFKNLISFYNICKDCKLVPVEFCVMGKFYVTKIASRGFIFKVQMSSTHPIFGCVFKFKVNTFLHLYVFYFQTSLPVKRNLRWQCRMLNVHFF